MTKGIWYTGPAGSGKSHKVYEDFNPATHYEKSLEDEWWDGYTGQEVVILNEFRGQIKFSFLLAMVDKWPLKVKQRCKEPVPFLAKEVRITSILHPKEVYKNALEDNEPWAQFERRFEVVTMAARSVAGTSRANPAFRFA